MGAAIIAGMGAKVFTDLVTSSEQMVSIGYTVEPNMQRHEQYSELYEVYERLYPDLRDAYHQIGALNVRD